MRYVGADRGLFVRKQFLGERYIQLAKSLNIVTLSQKELSRLIASYNIDSLGTYTSGSDALQTAGRIFDLLRKFEPKTANYILSGYWEDPPWTQIPNIVASASRLKQNSQLEENKKCS